MRYASAILMAALAVTAGCVSYEGDESSSYYRVPAGSRLNLHQALTIPAEQVSVFIQDGRVVPSSEIRKYYPHCRFELYTLRNSPRTVAPDEFTVTRTVQEEVHSVDAGPLKVARLARGVRIDSFDDGGTPILVYATRMYLHSAKQPDVFRLNCGQWVYPPFDRHVTIAEIRQTLGPLLTLQTPPRTGTAR